MLKNDPDRKFFKEVRHRHCNNSSFIIMTCSSVAIPTSPAARAAKEIFTEHRCLRRSRSSNELCKRASIRRSYSDNYLCCRVNNIRASSTQPKQRNENSLGNFPFQLWVSSPPRSISFETETSTVEPDMVDDAAESNGEEEVKMRANWVERILQIRSHWQSLRPKEGKLEDEFCTVDDNGGCDCDRNGGCIADYSSEDEGEEIYDRESFSRHLVRVPWSDTKNFSKLAFLSNKAYVIPQIKAEDLKINYDLQFVRSSLEKKAEAGLTGAKLESCPVKSEESGGRRLINPSFAYKIAASAATYVHSRAKNLLSPSESGEEDPGKGNHPQENGESSSLVNNPEVAAFVAASTMTAVVAAEEKQKLKTAKDLQSMHSSPCEWFVCDDSTSSTRFFVIQGSDSFASWQANLFFEPIKFEGTDVLVHRGIYEAAKGIYEQFMPEIIDHLDRHGDEAKFQFTGHSLGGSLSLLVHLMVLKRNLVKPFMLQPVVTFGSPFVFCGGEKILDELGLDEDNIHCVIMHRDIVPRAFSCNYPDHVAVLLKRLNSSFRSHSCLNANRLLYSPLGKIFILQPDEKSSPPHPLLPRGCALYALDKAQRRFFPSVLRAFLNHPHPLETLSDPTAYGSDGSILRDHDSSNYFKALNGFLKQHTNMMIRRIRKQRTLVWPLATSPPSPLLWNHQNNLESTKLLSNRITTRV